MSGLAVYESVDYIEAINKRRSAKLLAALREHHDFNTHVVPEGYVKPKPIVIHIPIREVICAKCSAEKAEERDPVTVKDIKKAVSKYYGLSIGDIDSMRRSVSITHPRQIGYYLARELTNRSFPDIGHRFGGKDHTSVIHGAKKIARLIKTDWTVAYDIAHLEMILENSHSRDCCPHEEAAAASSHRPSAGAGAGRAAVLSAAE